MPEAATIDQPHLAQTPAATMSFASVALGLAACLLWFMLWRHLANEWSVNEQYGYGWFVPFFAAYLFWLRWDEGAPHERKSDSGRQPRRALIVSVTVVLLGALLPLRLFEVGNPDWRPLAWAHAAIVVSLTLFAMWRIGGRETMRHFAFPLCFIFVAVPWVTPVEAPIVQGLMGIVAAVATETLALFGIPAQLEGSVIRISSGVVGVNEACSGVRSLQTSLMIGLLFGELKRLSISRRIALVAGAASIAFIANCARAFFLVWVAAHDGVAAVDRWHDAAGYTILGAVFIGTLGLATLLHGGSQEVSAAESQRGGGRLRLNPVGIGAAVAALCWILLVEAAVELWYRSHERNLVETPTWDVRWPESAPGFREVSMNEDVKATLRFDRGRQVSWTAGASPSAAGAKAENWSMFFFRWEPGTTSILRARSHRPDICLPNTGWRVTADHGVRAYAVVNGVEMPFRHFAFARDVREQRTFSAHAFFCQREDRVQGNEANRFDLMGSTVGVTENWMRADRLRVVQNGLRNQGQQVLEVVVVTPQELSGAAAQEKFAALVPDIVHVAPR
jgi:exosortase